MGMDALAKSMYFLAGRPAWFGTAAPPDTHTQLPEPELLPAPVGKPHLGRRDLWRVWIG